MNPKKQTIIWNISNFVFFHIVRVNNAKELLEKLNQKFTPSLSDGLFMLH